MDILFRIENKKQTLAVARARGEEWALWLGKGKLRKKWEKVAEGDWEELAREYNHVAGKMGAPATSASLIKEAARQRRLLEESRDALVAKGLMGGLGG